MSNIYERFLRIDQIPSMSEVVRARAVYIVGWSVIAVQLLNLASMTYSYGGWTVDHMIACCVIAAILVGIHSLRFHRCFPAFGIFFSFILFGAVFASALNEQTGINSALLPFLILGAVLNGFICGWRAVAVFCVVGLMGIYALFHITTVNAPLEVSGLMGARNFQRAVQGVFALIMVSVISGIFSHNMHNAFGLLEYNLKRVKEADYAKSAFISNMSHELRTPMNGVIGASDVLIKAGLDSSQLALAHIIKKSGQNIVEIMDDVLIFSQIATGKFTLLHERFNLSLCVKMAFDAHQAMGNNKGLLLNLHIDPDVPQELIGDGVRLRQILSALISNAVKFTEQGAVLIVVTTERISQGQATVSFAVKDTGIGISQENIARVFERFEQVDTSNIRAHDGTGLGLTICQQLVEVMGGKIVAQSCLGRGSVFTATFNFKIAKDNTVSVTPSQQDLDENVLAAENQSVQIKS